MLTLKHDLPNHLTSAAAASHHSVSAAVTASLNLLLSAPAATLTTVLTHRADSDPFSPQVSDTSVYVDDTLVARVSHLAAITGLSVPQLTSMALEHHLLAIGAFPEHDGHQLHLPPVKFDRPLTVLLYEDDLAVIEKKGGTTSKHLHEALRQLYGDHRWVLRGLLARLKSEKPLSSDPKCSKRVSFRAQQAHWEAAAQVSAHFCLAISQMIRLQLHT